MDNVLDIADAGEIVRAAVLAVVPDADLDMVDDDAPFREELELDSLDFLTFVEQLGRRTGMRVEEDDYSHLRTLAECVRFVQEHATGSSTPGS